MSKNEEKGEESEHKVESLEIEKMSVIYYTKMDNEKNLNEN